MTKPFLVTNLAAFECPEGEVAPASGRSKLDPFLGVSEASRRLRQLVHSVLGSQSPILLLGETGSGKSLLASWIHQNGPRACRELVDLNCAGLSMDLLESELFGHERGAFTGAAGTKPGLLELADGGSLFLDEIGDMDLRVQPKLLKVLEEQRFRRLGDVRYRQVDVRVIAATHQDLAAGVRNKQFRSDLYYRINALPIRIPPLRERRQDLPLLAAQSLRFRSASSGRAAPTLSADALQALMEHSWPGNIRELNNVLERALLRQAGDVITRDDISLEPGSAASVAPTPAGLTLEEVKRRHITAVLREEGNRVDRAAIRLGVPKSTLYQKIKHLGIDRCKR
jgi:transcriptional regulator with GAF, ATPase, and Fis domain